MAEARKREKILTIITVSIALIAFIYSVVIERVVLRWKMLNEEIESRKNLLIGDAELLSRYENIKEEYMKNPIFKVKGANEEEAIARVLSEIEAISNKASCYITNIKPRTTRYIGNYREISFDVSIESGITELSRFMYETEVSKEILRIRRFTTSSKSGPAKSLKTTFIISKIIQ